MPRWTSLVALFAVFVVVAVPAHACDTPQLQVNPGEAGAGDRVVYSISNTTSGAEYVVRVAGIEVARGRDEGDGVRGRAFRMPDLGSTPRTPTVEAEVTHLDIPATDTWTSTVPGGMRYHVAANSTTQSGPATQPAPTQDAPSRSQPASTPADAPASGGQAGGATGSAPGTGPASGPGGAKGGGSPAGGAPSTGQGASEGAGAGAANLTASAASGEAARSGRPAARERPSAAVSQSGYSTVRSLEHATAGPLEPAEDPGRSSITLIAAGIAALMFAAGVAGRLVARGRGGGADVAAGPEPPAPSPSDPVEAALQEIIAEEKAKRATGDSAKRDPARS